MKSEAEIRKQRDRIQQAISMVDDQDSAAPDVQAGLFLMQTHEKLLSWALDECDEVDAVYEDLENGLKELISEN